jgi:hypothetical protein
MQRNRFKFPLYEKLKYWQLPTRPAFTDEEVGGVNGAIGTAATC